MGKDKKKEKEIEYLIRLFWIFIIGSIVGFIYENVLVLFQKGHFELRQGLLYGPFIPVYGIGAVVYELVVPKMKNSIEVFIYTMFFGGVTEYVCSYLQEVLFGTISWDYSWVCINFNGRTSILHAFYWGIAGVLFFKIVHPWFDKAINKKTTWKLIVTTSVLFTIILMDVLISWTAVARQKERILNEPANTSIDRFLDKHYPDDRIDKVYTNKIVKINACT